MIHTKNRLNFVCLIFAFGLAVLSAPTLRAEMPELTPAEREYEERLRGRCLLDSRDISGRQAVGGFNAGGAAVRPVHTRNGPPLGEPNSLQELESCIREVI